MSSLVSDLESALPAGHSFIIHHISSTPTRCDPIYSPPPSEKLQRTYVESHFINVSIRQPSKAVSKIDELVAILAMECLIYTTRTLTTIFVSKADSTGFLSLLKLPKEHESPLRTIASTFISFLARTRLRPGIKLVVDLFARASDQYLYPGSVENDTKHVADDRQLVKWWCRVLTPLLQSYAPKAPSVPLFASLNPSTAPPIEKKKEITAQGYLVVPGEDSIASYIPTNLRSRWQHTHPLRQLAQRPNLPPRCLIPHFPDDPKGRFVNELDEELPDANSQTISSQQNTAKAAEGLEAGARSPSKRGNGEWRSVKTLEAFWEMMAYRSECSSGRVVGFIWVLIETPGSSKLGGIMLAESQDSVLASKKSKRDKNVEKIKSIKTGKITSRLPRIKRAPSESLPIESPYYIWPENSRGTLVLEKRQYDKAHEILLRLDFATLPIAQRSTRAWVDEVGVLSGKRGDWGIEVVGKKEATRLATNGMCDSNGGVNMLGIKRKTKETNGDAKMEEAPINILGSGMIRKKAKRITPITVEETS